MIDSSGLESHSFLLIRLHCFDTIHLRIGSHCFDTAHLILLLWILFADFCFRFCSQAGISMFWGSGIR